MACYYPIDAWRTDSGEITFKERGAIHSQLQIACGRCIGCRLERAHMWATRCVNEASMHDHNMFLTLTYDDEHLPHGGVLVHQHFQAFMKRLREACSRARKLPRALHGPAAHLLCKEDGRVGFYMSGEYGSSENTKRPHYHAIIFGADFFDKKIFSDSQDRKLWTSASLDQLWGQGFSTIGEVNYQTASYVARYIIDKITGDMAREHYEKMDTETGEIINLPPEYNAMSKRPPIGQSWLKKYYTDIYPKGSQVINGTEMKPPKFYDRRAKEWDPISFEQTEFERQQKGAANYKDQTRKRLKARETVAKARVGQLKRNTI